MEEVMKYKQIENYIIERIESGELKVGDQIETEEEISKKLNISHLTVNKALSNLAKEGYLTRTRGKGSFVKSRVISNSYESKRYFSLTEDIERIGKKPGSKLIEYKVISGKDVPEIAKVMNVGANDKLHYFIRVRTADDEPIAISYTYLSAKSVPYVDINVLENGSLWKFLAETGFVGTKKSYFKLYAKLPTEEQQKLLGIDDKTPLLLSHHLSETKDGIIYNYVDTYYISERYEYFYTSEIDRKHNEQKVYSNN